MLANWKFAAPNPLLEKEARQFLQLWDAQATFEIQSSGTTGTPQIFRFSHKHVLGMPRAVWPVLTNMGKPQRPQQRFYKIAFFRVVEMWSCPTICANVIGRHLRAVTI